MFEHRFDWDPVKARNNRRKHGVEFKLATTVFDDPFALSIPDEDHGRAEDRWVTQGRARNGMLLVIVHTYHEVGADAARVRIISARRSTRHERRQYESGR